MEPGASEGFGGRVDPGETGGFPSYTGGGPIVAPGYGPDDPNGVAAKFAKDLARYGLTPMDLLTFQDDPATFTRASLTQMSGWDRFREILRNIVTGSYGLPGLTGAFPPGAQHATDAAATLIGMPFGLGGVSRNVVRGLVSGSTGTNADFGGGFRPGDPRSMEGIAGGISQGGRTVGLNLYAQGPETIASDAYPGLPTIGGYGAQGAPTTAFPPAPGMAGLPLPESPQAGPPGLPLPQTVAQPPTGPAGAGPSPYAGLNLPPAVEQRLVESDATLAQIKAALAKGDKEPNKVLQAIAVAVAGVGDVARNLQTDPRTGVPLYKPSAELMTGMLAAQQKAGDGTGAGGGGGRLKALADIALEDRKSMLDVWKFAQTADESTRQNMTTFIAESGKIRDQVDAGLDKQAASNAILAMARKLKMPPEFDVLASTNPQDIQFGKALGALSAYLPTDPKDAASMAGITLAQYKKAPKEGLEALKAAAALNALPDATARVHAAVKTLRRLKDGDSTGPLSVDEVRDIVMDNAGDKALAMREAFAGTLFTSPEMRTAFKSMLTREGVEDLDAQAKTAEEDRVRAGKVKDIPVTAAQSAATKRAGIPVEVEQEEATRGGKVQTAEAEAAARVRGASGELSQGVRDALQGMGVDPNKATPKQIQQAREIAKTSEPDLATRIAAEVSYRRENRGKTKDPSFRGLTETELMDRWRALGFVQEILRGATPGGAPPGYSPKAP